MKTLDQRQKKNAKVNIILYSIVALIIFGIVYFIKTDNSQTKKQFPDKGLAYIKAQHFVEDNLKSPGSASFSCCEYTAQINKADSTFLVASHVEALNGMNIKVKSKWAVKMKFLNDKDWKLLDIKID